MRRILPILVLLALVIGAAIFLFRGRMETEGSRRQVAEFLPANTYFLARLTDLPRTMKRWEATSWRALAAEPEWVSFSQHLGEYLPAETQNGTWEKLTWAVIAQREALDPVELFLATLDPDPASRLVMGLRYRGRRSEVQRSMEKIRAELFRGQVAPTSVVVKGAGLEMEKLTSQGVTLALAYADDWIFFSQGTEPMSDLLQRYASADLSTSLAREGRYTEAAPLGLAEPDVQVFCRWDRHREYERQLVAKILSSATQMLSVEKFQWEQKFASTNRAYDGYYPDTLSYTLKLDGPLIRDRLYVHLPKFPKVGNLQDRLVTAMPPTSLFYGVVNVEGWTEFANEWSISPVGNWSQAFGPEVAVQAGWEAGPRAIPEHSIIMQVRNKEKARDELDLWAPEFSKRHPEDEVEAMVESPWSTRPGLIIGLNNTRAVYGWNQESAKRALQSVPANADSLGGTDRYQSAWKSVPAPELGWIYLDVAGLFERWCEKRRTALQSRLAKNQAALKFFDPEQLPKAATISRHLAPLATSIRSVPGGLSIESAGSVTPGMVYFWNWMGFGVDFF